MDNPLSKLVLDYWYKALMVVSVVVFLSAGAGLLREFPTVPTATISLGGFFIGIGEWINHPLQTALMRATASFPGGVLSGHRRSPKPTGVAFDILGTVLICIGIYRLLA